MSASNEYRELKLEAERSRAAWRLNSEVNQALLKMDRLEAIAYIDLLDGEVSGGFEKALEDFRTALDHVESFAHDPPPHTESTVIVDMIEELNQFRADHGDLQRPDQVPEASWRLWETLGYAGSSPPPTRWYRLDSALQTASMAGGYAYDHVDYSVARAISQADLDALPAQTAAWIRSTVSSSQLENTAQDNALEELGTLRLLSEHFSGPTRAALRSISEPLGEELERELFDSDAYELIVATVPYQLGRTDDLEISPGDLFVAMDTFAKRIATLAAQLEQHLQQQIDRDLQAARSSRDRAAVLMLLPLGLAIALFVALGQSRRRWDRELIEAAEHDALTGLANRTALQRTTDVLLQRATSSSHTHAGVLLVDLDNFKAINDAFGHHVGDSVLRQFARRLEDCVRPDELLFRLGGDEFVFLALGDAQVINRLEAIAERVAELAGQALRVEEHDLHIECSCGASMRNLPTNLSELLVESDLALHEIKEADKGRFLAYGQTKRGPIIRRLPAILDRDGLEFVFQPQVDLPSGKIVGVEGLCRWPSDDDASGPSLPYVSPIDIVDSAEWLGATERFLHNLITKFAEANRILEPHFDGTFWLNIWPSQLLTASAAETLLTHLDSSGIALDRLGIEITEKLPLADENRAAQAIQELRDAGVRVALDDFGVFNASIERLTSLPLDAVKLDRKLVRGIAQSAELQLFVQALCSICRNRGLSFIAEGVEDRADLEALAEVGLERIQGFLVTAALPPEALLDFLVKWDPIHRVVAEASGA